MARTYYASLSLIAAFCADITTVQATALSTSDQTAIEAHYEDLLSSKDLHTIGQAIGPNSKGIVLSSPPVQLPHDKNDKRDLATRTLHSMYCHSDAIVIGTFVDSHTLLSKNKDMIFTISTFKVGEVVKPSQGITSGGTIRVIRPGGEIDDVGEHLNVAIDEVKPFQANTSYLLDLRRDASASSDLLFASEPSANSIVSGRIHPDAVLRRGLLDGTPVAEATTALKTAGADCNAVAAGVSAP